jgi:LmbE family N-acetylglucosaminyl deacetylase
MKVLCICAHPDDEALGCGGTLALHAKRNDAVTVCFMTDGERARTGATAANVTGRRKAAEAACGAIGVRSLEFARFPDNQLDTVPLLELAKHVETLADRHAPDIVYTHHGGDLNVDHRLTFQAVLTAFRPTGAHGTVVSILSFEVPSSTEWSRPEIGPAFVPNHFVDISGTLDHKLAAIEAYAGEMRPFPHPRSPEALRSLAAWRGANAGVRAAEAFMLVRRVVSGG